MVGLRVRALITRQAEETELLLIRHRRRARYYAVLPGGKIEDHETIADALVREVREESGLEVRLGKLLFVADVIGPQGLDHVVNLTFHCTLLGGELKAKSQDSPSLVERGDLAYFVPISRLSGENLYPPISQYIEESFIRQFKGDVQYLGNVWKEFEEVGHEGQQA